MNILFIHGFGGARGPLERALATAAHGGPHHLFFVRWPSGDLREMRARAVVEVARRVAEKKSLPRGLMEAALQGGRQVSEAWEQAVANVPAGAEALHQVLASTGADGKGTAIVAFSLGCRVVLHALADHVAHFRKVERVVFAASAAPASSFEALSPRIADGTEVIHVYSRKDTILDRVYPLGEGRILPSGREPLYLPGVKNVEVVVGHRGYSSIASRLLALATGEESADPVALISGE